MTLNITFEEEKPIDITFSDVQVLDNYDKGKEDGYKEAKENLETAHITANGTHTPKKGVGFSQVTVDVPDMNGSFQEGYDNAISKLKPLSVQENGTYTPTVGEVGYNEVNVNIDTNSYYEQGKTDGYAQGETDGYSKGQTDGYTQGKTDGQAQGEIVGYDKAVSELKEITITENGVHTPQDGEIGFNKINVNVGGETETVNKLAQIVDKSITEVTAKDLEGATKIGEDAFHYCEKLTSVVIPNSVTSIGDTAFSYCSYLTNIEIPSSVTSIGYRAFYNCTRLSKANYKGTINQWVQISFGNSNSSEYASPTSWAKDLYINNELVTEAKLTNVTSIGSGAFYNCKSLVSVEIPNTVISIAYSAFYGCNSLTSIIIPDSVTSIGMECFKNCSKLSSVEIGGGLTQLSGAMFYYCGSLTSIVIPPNIKSMGGNALSCGSGTNRVTVIMQSETPPTIYSNTFNTSTLGKIIVPKGCLEAYQTATNWSKFADYMEEANE